MIADQPRYETEEENTSSLNRTEKKIKSFDDSEMISYLSRFQ
ncbi:hypothetical protein ACQ1R0_05880 [Ornithobacterium rhinotracheale]|nr:hypothetical protein [Ornithobacterium rhinotracheale]